MVNAELTVFDNDLLMKACLKFFNSLTEKLGDRYTTVTSCNNDRSEYLVPNGTADEITYEGKPDMSFRVSDHWNWFSTLKKCKNRHYVQCFSRDIRRPRSRVSENGPSKPISACSVAIFYGNAYHVVYGEYYDKKKRAWMWKEATVEEVLRDYKDHIVSGDYTVYTADFFSARNYTD